MGRYLNLGNDGFVAIRKEPYVDKMIEAVKNEVRLECRIL